MKYTPKQYARALYELLAGSPVKDSNSVLRGFVNALRENNDLSRGEEIMSWFEKIYHEESGKPLFEVKVAEEKSEKILAQEIKGDVRFKKDRGLVGGARIRVGDLMVDNTIKVRLERLRAALSK